MADLVATERRLGREITPLVERSIPGIEVLAVELLSPSRFCVYIDHPGGVDHALCGRVTQVLGDYRANYTIDVSSPGLERPLRTPSHFEAAVGRRVAVRTRRPIAGKNRFRGAVAAAGARELTIDTGGDVLAIPYDDIVRGNLLPDTQDPN